MSIEAGRSQGFRAGRLFGLIGLGFLIGFALFVVFHQRSMRAAEAIKVANHARVVSSSLWTFEDQTPRDYLNLAIEANNYRRVTVLDESGRVFIEQHGDPLPVRDRVLKVLGLVHVHHLEQEIVYQGRVIGTIQVDWLCGSIYTYAYILLCLVLLLGAVWLYLKLIEAKGQLENRVRQRTAELEREVGERKRAEEELRYQTQRLAMHVRHTPLGVVEWSPDFEVVDWNRAAERIFGFRKEEILGKSPFGTILPSEEESRIRELWQLLMAQQGGNTSVNLNLTKGGEQKTCSWYNTPLTGPDGRVIGVGSLVLDITDQVEAERRSRTLQQQLLQAQKMEAVGSLAGGIAHDFNNLLQSISGFTQLLLMDCRKQGGDCRRLEGIEQASGRAAELVRQLLTFSRKLESKLTVLDLNQEIVQVRSIIGRTIPKMVAIDLRLDPELAKIEGDTIQIEQILLNLVINANHAMPEGGTLTIETRNVFLDQAFCRARLGAREGANVLLRVQDTGIGMDPETVQRIFEPFFTTKETGEGTGLGLSMVYGIVIEHNGWIECSSEKGRGTEFRIYFPAVDGEAAAEFSDPAEAETGSAGGDETILLVDDEATIRDIGREMLENHGYRPLLAGSGEAGLEIFRERPDRIDLVIMDLNMPGMGGLKCLQAMRSIRPDCPMIVASGYLPAEVVERAEEAGAAGFLSKPFQLQEFIKAVQQALNGTGNRPADN